MTRKRQIHDLVIDEISLVDKGANQHAVVTIAKNADGEKENGMEIFDEQGNPLDPDTLDDGDVVYGEDGQAYLFELDSDGEGAEQAQDDKELETVGKSFENPFRRQQEATTVSKSGKSFADEVREELSKALTDKDRDEVISKAMAQFDALATEVSKAQQAAENERQIRLHQEYVEVAKSYNLPIQDEVLGGVLLECAEKLSEESCTIIAKCLEAAGEAVFLEQGAIGGGDNSDVLAQVNAYANTQVSKSGMTPEEFQAEVFSSNPELYDEYLSEKNV